MNGRLNEGRNGSETRLSKRVVENLNDGGNEYGRRDDEDLMRGN